MLDWDKLKTFYQVAKIGNFTEAASKLNLSQSALSRQVIAIEDRLGVSLFQRLRKGLVLTQEGQILFQEVEKMYQHADYAERVIQHQRSEVEGLLSIYTNDTLAAWLIPLFPGFLKTYPDIRFQIKTDPTVEGSEGADVIIGPFHPDRDDLDQTHLCTLKNALFASRAYLDRQGYPQSVKDLDSHQLLTISPKGVNVWDRDRVLRIGREKKPRTPYFEAQSSTQLLLKAAQAGMGIIQLPERIFSSESRQLVRILEHMELPPSEVYVMNPVHKSRYKVIQVFKSYLLRAIQDPLIPFPRNK